MRLPMLAAFASCTQKSGVYLPPADTGDADTDVDSDADADADADADTDLDGDGFTVEEGDCDDASIYVNPAREEDTTDAIDNDCDGRTDEDWSGVTVAYANSNGAGSLLVLDTVGRIDDEVALPADVTPMWIDHGIDDGWIVNNAATYVTLVGPDGAAENLADFSEDEDMPFCYGVATHPDGYYLTSQLGRLVAAYSDGTTISLAEWAWDWTDTATFQMAVYTVAVDLRTGEVGLFDYFGGFATWSEGDGLVIHRVADLDAWDGTSTYSGAAKDGGGWFTAAYDSVGGTFGVFRFDLDSASWTQRASWYDSQWTPNVLAIDGDDGDYYVTANAGWYYTVWRVRDEDDEAATLYVTDGTEANRSFQGIVSNYE